MHWQWDMQKYREQVTMASYNITEGNQPPTNRTNWPLRKPHLIRVDLNTHVTVSLFSHGKSVLMTALQYNTHCTHLLSHSRHDSMLLIVAQYCVVVTGWWWVWWRRTTWKLSPPCKCSKFLADWVLYWLTHSPVGRPPPWKAKDKQWAVLFVCT